VPLGVGDVCGDDAGTDHGHADQCADALEVMGEGLAEADHGVFAGRVGAKARGRGQAGHGADVDDMARGALFEHARDEGSDAVDGPVEVDPEDPGPVVGGRCPEGPVQPTPALLHRRWTAPKVSQAAPASAST